MSASSFDVVICGAGIAGVSTAYHLAIHRGITSVALVDLGPPLSMTSDKSLECYRNWYPGPGNDMVALVNRSIDIMEAVARQTEHRFNMNRRGYAFATACPVQAERFKLEAEEEARLGAGPLRIHAGQSGKSAYQPAPAHGFEDQPTGSDLLLDPGLIRTHFPHLTHETVAVLHARRCGWLSAHQYATHLLEQARQAGVSFIRGRVDEIQLESGNISGVRVQSETGTKHIRCGCFVSATGPLQHATGALMGLELPIVCELHLKAAFKDTAGVFPRDTPMLIWTDPGPLVWTEDERAALEADVEARHLLKSFPGGVHGRPEGSGDTLILQWTLDTSEVAPEFPFETDPYYPEMLQRAMTVAVPGLNAYFGQRAKPFVDGGYYAKTPENRPLAGPLPVPGAYIAGALSGFGMQSGSALGELVSLHIAGDVLPDYASAFMLERYEDPSYQSALESADPALGQI